jgi:Mce-associated membrane protein
MAEADEPPTRSPGSAADAKALLEEAEAEAVAAEAVVTAARARARAARLRREALAVAESVEDYGDAAAAAADADAEAAALEEDDDYEDEWDDEWDDESYEESDEDSDEAVEAAAPDSETSRAAWRNQLPSVSTAAKLAAIALILGFAWLSAYMTLEHRDATQRRQREDAFVAAAKQGTIDMTSLDFNTARADVQRLIDTTTGEFRDDFQQRADDFAGVVAQSKAITEGTVDEAAIDSVDGNSAAVLILATSRITNSPPGKDEPPRTWRLRVTVTEVGGRYKMSKVEYVP